MTLIFKAIILGIVEGITEFLPISSTGHLIIVNRFINFTGNFANMFDVVIQLGAILSVIIYFRKRLYPFSSKQNKEIWKKIIAAAIPAFIIGGIFGNKITESLFNPITVAIALFTGGVFLVIIENKKKSPAITALSALTYPIVIFIGLFQCLAMIPGTSRAAATIIAALLLGVTRQVAVEFSFFLAIPTIFAASVYSLFKYGVVLSAAEWTALLAGFAVSFFTAWVVIAVFMNYIAKHNFKLFGYYRIVLAIIIGLLLFI